MKDPNFEFLSSWNMSEYEDSVNSDTVSPVTEMTDERFQELGFPVPQGAGDTRDRARPPPDTVINNPFITFVSRKYSKLSKPQIYLRLHIPCSFHSLYPNT